MLHFPMQHGHAQPYSFFLLLQKGHSMLVSIVTFSLTQPWSVAQAQAVFESTAPKYLHRPGLLRKHYYIAEDGRRAGGIYFWQSRADADACYTDEWRATVTEKYGAAPEIFFAHAPVTVDNIQGAIEQAE